MVRHTRLSLIPHVAGEMGPRLRGDDKVEIEGKGVSITRTKFACPVSAAAVRADWRRRGFSCENFVDPPGREWNDFVHDTGELVTVLQGRLRCLMNGNTHDLEAGDELFIPKGVRHSVHNIHAGTTRWLFGYG